MVDNESGRKIIKHYGTPRRSGRYPWGSGNDPYQSSSRFLGEVARLRSEGLSEKEIATGFGITTTELRHRKSLARAEKRAGDAAQAWRLKEKGLSNVAIGERMGINESSVRALLDPSLKAKAASTQATADVLKAATDSKKYIDIGVGTEQHMGITRTKLNTAVALLQKEGYEVHYLDVKQVGTGKNTRIKVLVPPGTTYGELSKNRDKIDIVGGFSDDRGHTFRSIEPIQSISSDRILVRYGEEGGASKDGVIELRNGVPDLDLGNSRYAQVRMGVDGKYYMKGMAMHSLDIPDGYDIVYNTNKSKTDDPFEAFKKLESDPTNPFSSIVRQQHYLDADGNERLSPLNIVGGKPGSGEEGSWDTWSKTLSSQILSKQNPALAQRQLDIALALRQEEFDEIMSITNPTVKKQLLESFADSTDAATAHLKAAALPRQANKVILPINSLKDGEVYAPTFRNGERVVLIRHPHGGIFEIPELTVNNRNAEGRSLLGDALDAVGINANVAQKLSGADFDGDTVIVIPNKDKLIKTAPSLKGLADFDPRTSYPAYDGMPKMTNETKQLKMGDVSNLITDMTIKGASPDEVARAVRHSMVVIDAEKHNLNYKQSYIDNGIAGLKEKYQGAANAGAATLISKANSTVRVPHRKEGQLINGRRVFIDPRTGKKLYEETGETYTTKSGKVVPRVTKSKQILEEPDAFSLSSGTRTETVYAEYANRLKSMANNARLQITKTKDIPYSKSAAKTFAPEVKSLVAKLNLAYRNKPLERKAQVLANSIVKEKRLSKPSMTKPELKKVKGMALQTARFRIGANKSNIRITDREWFAIQAGAITPSRLSKILKNTDLDALKSRALPPQYPTFGGDWLLEVIWRNFYM